ncbi:MAG: bifunctional phosphopantothenoylcysteine decarboxylase/phosphopantothenate--cysteine ligase CoaBC [Armatimonadota bacterium]
MDLNEKTVILGVTGGIAAYKAAELASALVREGAEVHVVMTEHATHFVGPATFRALTGREVVTGLWEEPSEYEITHVSLPDRADLFLIAPATANILGKVAGGIADDMLSTMICATTAPVIFAPAMNCKMWRNPAVQANVERLRSLGYEFVEPERGRLACGVEDIGRLASTSKILKAVLARIGCEQDLAGVTVMVTAGPTQEPIDPVRFIANRSSGKMGYAIAGAAAERGARVILVSGPTELPVPPGVERVDVRTAREMEGAVLAHLPEAQVVIGAAAVADYTPKLSEPEKIKKADFGLVLELEPTVDIMAELGRRKDGKVLVGFAAETEKVIEHAKSKLESKNLDFIVANDVSKPGIGFGSDDNEVTIIGADGSVEELPRMAKSAVAEKILDKISRRP